MKWDEYFIKMAMLVASKSKDPSTKVGCVIVGPDNEVRSTGFNGFPRGVVEEVPGTAHIPLEVGRDVLTNEYKVKCSCGSVQIVPTPDLERRGSFDIPMKPEQISDKLAENAAKLEHFKPEPDMVLHPERWERPTKYEFVEHAERNAVYNAARVGISLDGCRAYLNWEPTPCIECTKAFIQAGIAEVIGPDIPFSLNKDWKFEVSQTIMSEAGLVTRAVSWDQS